MYVSIYSYYGFVVKECVSICLADLWLACHSGNTEEARQLIRAGANVNSKDSWVRYNKKSRISYLFNI